MLLQEFLPRKVADSAIMGECHRAPHAFSKMQGQKLLTHC